MSEKILNDILMESYKKEFEEFIAQVEENKIWELLNS